MKMTDEQVAFVIEDARTALVLGLPINLHDVLAAVDRMHEQYEPKEIDRLEREFEDEQRDRIRAEERLNALVAVVEAQHKGVARAAGMLTRGELADPTVIALILAGVRNRLKGALDNAKDEATADEDETDLLGEDE